MFFNILYLYSFDAINLQKLPFFTIEQQLELLYYSVILTFSPKNGTPAGAPASFHPFFSPLRPGNGESILWKQFLCCIEEKWKYGNLQNGV